MTKSVLITGASSGIGYQTALTLKAAGYRVFASARKPEDVAKLSAQGLEGLQLDVTDPASIQTALATLTERTHNELYALFNNAGYMQPGAIEDLTPAMIETQFATNVFGAMQVVQQVLPIMRQQGYGRIIQNSSILGVITIPFMGAYCASKFALEGFSKSLRQELQGTQIFVSLVNPGPIESKLRERSYGLYQAELRDKHSAHYDSDYRQLEQSYGSHRSKGTYFTLGPEAVAKVVLKILATNRPKLHYFVTTPAKCLAVLRKLLPDNLLDWLLAKAR